MIRNWMSNQVARNAGWILFGKAARMVVNLLVGVLTARYLGPSNLGLLGYAAAYTGFFSSFCTLGLHSILVKEFMDRPGGEGEILGTSLVFRAVSSGASAVVILCVVWITDRGDPTVVAVAGLCCLGMVFQVFEVFGHWFQSRFQSKVTAGVSLLAYLIAAGCKVIGLVKGKSVEWFAFSLALEHICAAVFLVIAYRRHHGSRTRVSLRYGRELLNRSKHFIVSGLMVAVYAQTDKIMLRQMISDAEIGYYSAAVSISGVWCFVLTAIIDSMYPEITKAFHTDEGLFRRRNKQLYSAVFYLCVGVSLVLTLLADPIISMIYGEAYLPAAKPLRVVTWYTGFAYLGVARNAWVVCKGAQRSLKYVYAAAAGANVALNLVLIPVWGAEGAAIASLMAQVVTTVIAPFFIRELRENAGMMIDAIRLKWNEE